LAYADAAFFYWSISMNITHEGGAQIIPISDVFRQSLGIDEILGDLSFLKKQITAVISPVIPEWTNLKKACEIKGVAYNSAKSKPALQPNHGDEDAKLNGRKVWRRDTVLSWLEKVDQ
jgi:hypothetical protein